MVHLKGEAAVAWASLASRLIQVARPASLDPDPARLLTLLEFCVRIAPKKTQADVEVSAISGFPSLAALKRLTAMREVAGRYLREHGARPGSGVPHLVLERAASDMAADMSLDPFAPLDPSREARPRRAALSFHVSRERRLCCPAELQQPLQAHLQKLGASLIVRSK